MNDLIPTQFHLESFHQPAGDQPEAIQKLVKNFESGERHQTLLGVTGSGKTFTIANTIKELGRPALVIAPNKTLAGQLFSELKELFPKNNVGFFISYYDYYQPEAYVPSSDTYIAKDSAINDDIDRMRHESTQALFEERATIVVASVSCIYGLGSPDAYANLVVKLKQGEAWDRDTFLSKLIDIQYSRNDRSLVRGCFRARGDTVDILPANAKDEGIRVEFFGDEVDEIHIIDSLTGESIRSITEVALYPNSHYVTERKNRRQICKEILEDLGKRLKELRSLGKMIEFQRLEQRTMQDVETIEHLGFCPGIENYSRYLSGANPGDPPPCLLDYFPDDFITIIDESHITVPQIGAMYKGDRSRKMTLVEYGFRLPAALDNRPLNFDEFLKRNHQFLYVSATPGPFELEKSGSNIAEQIIRPTGLIDPEIEIKKTENQVDDLYAEITQTTDKKFRVLVTTLTKRMAEDLSEYYGNLGVSVKYLHSDIDALERAELLRDLRKGEIDVLIGINLLREGLDLPEVGLVAVMDADKEGFLRSKRSLIQIVGRAARNSEGRVIFYADKRTDSMNEAINETDRRRAIQIAHNEEHGIIPTTVKGAKVQDLRAAYGIEEKLDIDTEEASKDPWEVLNQLGIHSLKQLEVEMVRRAKSMHKASEKLDFEKAAMFRDELNKLKSIRMLLNEDS